MNRHRLLLGLCLILLVLAATPPPTAAADCQDWVARTVSVQGRVETRRAGESQWVPVQIGAAHCLGDAVRLGTLSRAAIVLREGGVVRLDQNTTITFTPPPERAGTWLDVLTGGAHFFTRAPRRLRITTPFVNGSVEGTEFLVEVDAMEARISVFEGRVRAENAQGSVDLMAEQSASARAGQAPTLRAIKVKPVEAVTWALYYPPVLDLRPDDFPDRPVRPGLRGPSLDRGSAPRRSRLGSRQRCRHPGHPHRASGVHLPRGLLLAVGRVDEATPTSTGHSDSHHNEATLSLYDPSWLLPRTTRPSRARWPIRRRRRSRVSRRSLALSYAQQAPSICPERARARRRPWSSSRNALAYARLAELGSSFGDLDRARAAAAEGARLDPAIARVQTVLGFAALTQIRRREARAAFERAIPLDQADPLPRLGLGLTQIRGGDLEEGRRSLEMAASLDPGDSLLRSYLGKAYYEERQPVLAADQYKLAEELDPKDPTPWLYDAIRPKASTGRSRHSDLCRSPSSSTTTAPSIDPDLLLDATVAARSANLARIYSDLGFQQRALVEGWMSVNTDPATSRRIACWPTRTPPCRVTTPPA